MRATAAWIVTGLVAVSGVAAVVVGLSSSWNGETAVVSRVVDGDTIEVQVNGRAERVQLLGVDAPVAVDPRRSAQCLGPQATVYLSSLLPVGSTVRLEYGAERTTADGRTLAAVFVDLDRLVNAEMARTGLAAVVGGGDRFAPAVQEAGLQARAARVGLYSPDIACTVPGLVAQLDRAVTEQPDAPAPDTATADDLGVASRGAEVVADTATDLYSLLSDQGDPLVAALAGEDRERVRAYVDEIRRGAAEELARLQAEADRRRAAEQEVLRDAARRVVEESLRLQEEGTFVAPADDLIAAVPGVPAQADDAPGPASPAPSAAPRAAAPPVAEPDRDDDRPRVVERIGDRLRSLLNRVVSWDRD